MNRETNCSPNLKYVMPPPFLWSPVSAIGHRTSLLQSNSNYHLLPTSLLNLLIHNCPLHPISRSVLSSQLEISLIQSVLLNELNTLYGFFIWHNSIFQIKTGKFGQEHTSLLECLSVSGDSLIMSSVPKGSRWKRSSGSSISGRRGEETDGRAAKGPQLLASDVILGFFMCQFLSLSCLC